MRRDVPGLNKIPAGAPAYHHGAAMKTSRIVAAGAAILASAAIAYAAGNYETYPVVGQPSFCASNVTGASGANANTGATGLGGVTGQGQAGSQTLCAQTVPAGPPEITGEELIPADTGTSASGTGAGTTNPQTVTIPSSLVGPLNTKINRLIGGDFGTNLWQRGTTPLTAGSATVATMTADRWWVIAQGNNLTVSKQTPASTAADYLGNIGFYSVLRFARPSGTPTGASCVGQVLDKQAAAPLIGNNAVFSFYGYAPTTYSATNGAVTVTIAYFTAADGAATQAAMQDAGANSSTFALSVSGQASGIAGYAAVTAGSSPNFPTATVANGVATVSLTTTPTRYAFYAPIPAANSAGTAVTAVGVAICGTFTATTTVATDYFEFTGAQLQALPSAAGLNAPNGVISPTGFERRAPELEAAYQYYYSYVAIEGGSTSSHPARGMCSASTTSAMVCLVPAPVPMRLAPAMQYTAGFSSCSSTACSAVTACVALETVATITMPVSAAVLPVECTSSTGFPAAGSAAFLLDDGGSGVISASAEP